MAPAGKGKLGPDASDDNSDSASTTIEGNVIDVGGGTFTGTNVDNAPDELTTTDYSTSPEPDTGEPQESNIPLAENITPTMPADPIPEEPKLGEEVDADTNAALIEVGASPAARDQARVLSEDAVNTAARQFGRDAETAYINAWANGQTVKLVVEDAVVEDESDEVADEEE